MEVKVNRSRVSEFLSRRDPNEFIIAGRVNRIMFRGKWRGDSESQAEKRARDNISAKLGNNSS